MIIATNDGKKYRMDKISQFDDNDDAVNQNFDTFLYFFLQDFIYC